MEYVCLNRPVTVAPSAYGVIAIDTLSGIKILDRTRGYLPDAEADAKLAYDVAYRADQLTGKPRPAKVERFHYEDDDNE